MSGLTACVSGSFHRHLVGVAEAANALEALGVTVLSPMRPIEVVDSDEDFLFLAGDTSRDVRLVQAGHLEAIARCDLLWVVAPDGYVGPSVSMEVGYAWACCIPVLSAHAIHDRTMREFVERVSGLAVAVVAARAVQLGRRRA